MQRILAAACFVLCLISPALAQKTPSQLQTEINTNLPDNTTGAITPALLRSPLSDIVSSIMPSVAPVSGNLACFNGTTGLLQDCGSAPSQFLIGTKSGNTSVFATTAGTLTSGNCAQWDANGNLTAASSPCGTGGGTPGGLNGQVQINNAGIFGGITNSQLTSLINPATSSLPGTLPAFPNTTTSYFRGDGTYQTLNVAAVSGAAPITNPSFLGTVILPITGSTQCLQVNLAGAIGGTGSGCISVGGSNVFTGSNTFTSVSVFSEVLGTVTPQAGTTYTFANTDCGTEITFTSAVAVTATIPATLPVGCNISILQAGTAKVSVTGSAVTPATLHSAHSYTGTSAQWAIIGINIEANVGGSSAVAILTGDGS